MTATAILREPLVEEREVVTESRSGTVVAVGLIAVLVIGMALGAVVTLIVVLSDMPSSTPPTRVERRVVLQPPAPSRPAPVAPRYSPPVDTLPPPIDPIVRPTPIVPPPPPAPPRTRPALLRDGDFIVQAGAFASRTLAERFARRLTEAGHPATVQTENALRRTPNVVVLDERFANLSTAQIAVQWLQQNEHITAIVTRRAAGEP